MKIRPTIAAVLILLPITEEAAAYAEFDRTIDRLSLDEKSGKWRDYFWSSAVLTLSDAFLLQHAGYGKSPGDRRQPHDLAARARLLETVALQGYSSTVNRKLTPTYAMFNVAGIHTGHYLFPRLRPLQPMVDRMAEITEWQNLTNLMLFTAVGVAVGYTLPRRRDVVDLHAEEKIDDTTRQHIGFFAYYTFRTSLLLQKAGYEKHPVESLAWRVAFGLGLAKEMIFDSMVGTGPSLSDAMADGIGTFLGYVGVKAYRSLKRPGSNLEFLPQSSGVQVSYAF